MQCCVAWSYCSRVRCFIQHCDSREAMKDRGSSIKKPALSRQKYPAEIVGSTMKKAVNSIQTCDKATSSVDLTHRLLHESLDCPRQSDQSRQLNGNFACNLVNSL